MFTHLHVHSHYSLLDGLSKIDGLIDQAKKHKMKSLALTDHGVMYGVIEFYQKAKETGIKPIIGVEAYMARHGHLNKRAKIDERPYHLILLAKNEQGYKNLVKLTTIAHLKGFYYKPRIDFELLKKYSLGLICLSACIQGEIPQLILEKQKDKAIKRALEYQEIFGAENFYLEVQDHPKNKEQVLVNKALFNISKKHNIPVVATNDVHYAKKEDAEIQDILLCLQTKRKQQDKDRMCSLDYDLSLQPEAEIKEAFKNHPEVITNTQKIVQACNLEIELKKTKLPYFPLPEGETADQYLRELCEEKISNRYPRKTKQITDRLDYELSMIKKAGFASYFLIVQDFVNWAKDNNIVVGPGRGCFLPDTKILLKNGQQKNIQDIKEKERIISHLGNKRKVKKILSYDINEEIAVIKSKVPVSDLKLTKDHKVLAIKHKMCPVLGGKTTICKPSCSRSCRKNLWYNYELQWIEAKNLEKNDFLVYPNVKHRQICKTFDLLHFNNLDTHLKGGDKYVWYEIGSNKLIQKKVKRFIKLDKKLAQLLGFYLSEGWSQTRRKYREARLGFGFHKNEKEYIKQVKQLLQAIFGLKASVVPHKTRNSCQVIAYSRIVAKFLERLCGQYSQNKHIPYQIFGCSDETIMSLLTSLFQGDGSRKDQMRISYDSSSFNLVSQIKMLLLRLGIMSSIKSRCYKNKNWNTSYKLTISGKQLFKFNQLFRKFQIPIKKQKFYRNDTFIWQNYFCFPVKEVLFKKYKGKVYDLTIEKDSSYIANEITVHNSVAGSIVSYALNITDIDPLKYGLIFERFLTGSRNEPPDIDLDFADTRRDEVIHYVEEKYGRDHVAQIITFGTMAARAAIRDVGRVLNYPYTFCDKLAKMIPFGNTLEKALKISDELKNIYQTNEDAQKIIDAAKKLEGVARHASKHACGVVIAPEALNQYVPTQYDVSGGEKTIITQYDMHAVEDIGLLKVDFLGLKNLTIIERTLKLIKYRYNKDIDIAEIPLNDPKTFKLLQKAETTGVFQLESGGVQRYLKQLKPTVFDDIIAMVALYRPGPMELIPDYIAGKKGLRKPRYLHPKLKPILDKTYGIAVFQEQVLQIVRDLAGFTLSEADVLRKAVGKKIAKLLQQQKTKFIHGCINNKISKETAERIFAFIEPFAGYGFNKSHATSYATISYQTAYLKANYPAEFIAALLTAHKADTDRISVEVEEARKMGLEVLPPDINESFKNFTVVDKKNIRFGLIAIKNVGEGIVQAIIEEREENGIFQNLEDFLGRVDSKDLNKKSMESLVKSGALDKFGERNHLLNNMETLLEFVRKKQKDKNNGQTSLFGLLSLSGKVNLKLKKSDPATHQEKLLWEREHLGFFVSEHPLKQYQEVIKKYVKPINQLELSNGFKGSSIKILGLITKIKKITTSSNENMIFVKVEDSFGEIEVIVFPKILKSTSKLWEENKMVSVEGRLSDKDEELKLIAENVKEVTKNMLDDLLLKKE